MSIPSASNSFALIFFAYAAAFAPWTAISSTDFISAEWKTVKETRQAEYVHVLLSSVPALLVVAYCVVQGIAGDFKETMAAAIAFLFATLHMARSVWGLWQLEEFQSWAEKSIDALEAMGVNYALYWDEEEMGRSRPTESRHIAEYILVNEKVIDNQITHGEVHCFLRFGEIELRTPRIDRVKVPMCVLELYERVRGSEFVDRRDGTVAVPRNVVTIIQWIAVAGMLVWEAALRVCGQKSKRKLEQIPMKPVKVWVRWGVVFASQGLGEWICKFNVISHPEAKERNENMSAVEMLHERGRYFGAEALASAALQLWPEMGPSYNRLNPFMWNEWASDSNMSDGRVVKEELFGAAIRSGEAMPFSTPHIKELTGNQGQIKSIKSSYCSYREELRKIMSDLPVRFVDMDEFRKFDANMLDWLAILLYLGGISRRAHLETVAERGRSYSEVCDGDRCTGSGASTPRTTNESMAKSCGEEPYHLSVDARDNGEDPKQNSPAQANLCTQLNTGTQGVLSARADSDFVGSLPRGGALVTAFPIMSQRLLEVSSGNRLVTKAGEMLDVWLALISGEQVRFLVKELNPEWEGWCLGPGEEGALLQGLYEEENRGKLLTLNIEVENKRLERRVADKNHRYRFLDQFVTFMGYRMESVRTLMARWVSQKGGGTGNVDEIFDTMVGKAREPISISIGLSESFSALMKTGQGLLSFKRKSVQCRLIWELQNLLEIEAGFHSFDEDAPDVRDSYDGIIDCFDGEDNKVRTVIIMLFVLSFPSLMVRAETEEEESEEENCRDKGCCCICIDLESLVVSGKKARSGDRSAIARVTITPMCGPQRVCVVASVKRSGVCQLSLSGLDKKFEWRWWRDAFLGRLAGFKQWQEQFDVESVELKLADPVAGMQEVAIATGVKFWTWGEWRPFRTSFCRYELESEELLLQPLITSFKVPDVIRDETGLATVEFPVTRAEAVKYKDAEDIVLVHTLALVQDAIERCGKTRYTQDVNKWDNTASKLMSMAEGEEPRRAFMLYEITAVQFKHMEALKKSLELAMEAPGNLELSLRGVIVLLGFAAAMLPEASGPFKLAENDQKKMRDEIIPLCKQLLLKWGDHRLQRNLLLDLISFHLASNPRDHAEDAMRLTQLALLLSDATEVPISGLRNIARSVSISESTNRSDDRIGSQLRLGTRCEALSRENKRAQRNIMEIAVKLGDAALQRRTSAFEAQAMEYATTEDSKALILEAQRTLWRIDKTDHFESMHALARLLSESVGVLESDAPRAVGLYERAIKEGNEVSSMFNLALLLKNGAEGVEVNAARAVGLFERAINEGNHVASMFSLALLLENGAEGVEVDAARAVGLYERAIHQGNDVDSMYNLALLLQSGAEGVELDVARAVDLYERAIDEGNHVVSMFNLGQLLRNGAEGVEVDAARAMALYERAISEGNDVDSMFSLALLLENGAEGVEMDTERAVRLYERAIQERNDVDSMNNLALLLIHGAEGVEADAAWSLSLYERAINERNDISSIFNLALLLENGAEGVDVDAARAVRLYERAINEGNDFDSMNNLALILEKGAEGVELDSARALELYERAISDGNHVDSMHNLARLLHCGAEGVEVDAARAVGLYERAIDEGSHVSAMYNLALLLESGAEGVEVDAARAFWLYERAANEGEDVDAMYIAGHMLIFHSGVETDAAKAKSFIQRAVNRETPIKVVRFEVMDRLWKLFEEGSEMVERDGVIADGILRHAAESGMELRQSNSRSGSDGELDGD